jgi:hypothetical protein
MASIKGHTLAWDPMINIALFGNGLTEYCNIKPRQRYRLIRASSFFSLTFYRFNSDDFIDFINDELVALDELEIPRQRKSMDTVKNWYGNKLLELCRGNNLFLLNGRVGENQQPPSRVIPWHGTL